ncbi:MAG: DUF402 domain-containing protein [Lachnospiraceae bacterium]|nr:DUF402 domain-containing protein [Lachnospiraceae bacterium]
MSRPRLFRRRFIPDENIELKDDMILVLEPDLIVTSWNVLKPRRDISRGVSAYYIDKGIKVSKIFDNAGQMVYWYCDIIETVYDADTNTYTFNDLLIDVIIYPDGQVEVLDMDEFADAMEQGILTVGTIAHAMRATDNLLHTIYSGEFVQYTEYIDGILASIR